jgi:hypothetical protein
MPSRFQVVSQVEIRASSEKVFRLVNNLNHWKDWYTPFQSANLNQLVHGADGVGAEVEWQKGTDNSGKIRIVQSLPSAEIVLLSAELKPRVSENRLEFVFEQNASLTNVACRLSGTRTYWQKLFGFFYKDKWAELQVTTSLENLKRISERP